MGLPLERVCHVELVEGHLRAPGVVQQPLDERADLLLGVAERLLQFVGELYLVYLLRQLAWFFPEMRRLRRG